MSEHRIKTYFRHLRQALIAGVVSSAFGWGAVIGASFIVFLGPLKMVQNHEWLQPFIAAAFAMLFVFAIHLIFIAPYRAFRMLRPFSIKVVAGHLETQYPMTQYECQKAAVLITNRSYLPRSNCVLHIMNVSGCKEHYFPRFIEEFSIQSGEMKSLTFMTWTSRPPPYENDKTIMLSGPVGWGWGGNFAALPCGSYDLFSGLVYVKAILLSSFVGYGLTRTISKRSEYDVKQPVKHGMNNVGRFLRLHVLIPRP